MRMFSNLLRRYAARAVAVVLIFLLYAAARPHALSESERADLASSFVFARQALPEVAGRTQKTVRDVHPSLAHFSAWISSVGASVALNDLDSDGFPNDISYVDVRTDQVIVAPAPGTAQRYQPFLLEPAPLPYDAKTMAPMGCLPGDFNEDGLMDVLVYYWGRTPVIFLRKGGGAAATKTLARDLYVPREVVPQVERWYTNAATQADLDGDGHVDIIIGNYFPDGARILDAAASGTEHMQDSMSRAFNGGRNRLLMWDGAAAGDEPSVAFIDRGGVLDGGLAEGWTLAVGAADLNGDLLPEIYFANDFGPDRLLYNQSRPGQVRFTPLTGVRHFTVPTSKVLGRDSFKGMGVDFQDINGDTLPDIHVSNIAEEYALEESHFAFVSTGATGRMKDGVAPYVDRAEPLGLARSGWGWDIKAGDFNNDGVAEIVQATGFIQGRVNRWPELHELAMGNDTLLHKAWAWPRFQEGADLSGQNHNPFFVRAADERYYDLARELGMDTPQVSRGVATADIDGDGRLDFAVANQWNTSYLYHNKSPRAGAFLALKVVLPVRGDRAGGTRVVAGPGEPAVPGRAAIGASATVHLPDGRRIAAQVDGGNGHSGKRSPHLHFGLGDLPPGAKVKVELRWRDTAGAIRHETLHLVAGWHTITLAA